MDSPTEFLHQLHFHFLPIDYGYLLPPNDGLATGAISIFGRATSVPAWWQTPCFQSEYPRGQLPWTDSPETASGGSYPWIWNGRPLPVWRFPLQVGPRGRRRTPIRKSTCNWERQNLVFYMESADFNSNYTKLHRELEITPNVIIDRSTLTNGDFATKIR